MIFVKKYSEKTYKFSLTYNKKILFLNLSDNTIDFFQCYDIIKAEEVLILKKFFCSCLLAGSVLFNGNYIVHGFHSYDELVRMGLKNDLINQVDQSLLVDSYSDEIYNYLVSGITSLSDIFYFHSNNISPETVRVYSECGVKNQNNIKLEYAVLECNAKKTFIMPSNTSIVYDIAHLIKKNVPVQVVKTFVEAGLTNPIDIISLFEHGISADRVQDYLKMGLDIRESRSALFESNLRVCDVAFLVEHKISLDVVRAYIDAGIEKSEDIVFFIKNNVSIETIQDYLVADIEMDEPDYPINLYERSAIVSLVKHNVSVKMVCDYVDAGISSPNNINFLVEHGISPEDVKDYLATGLDTKKKFGSFILENKLRVFDVYGMNIC